jgi:hypothetical protein
MLTPFKELDAVLADFTGSVHDILGDSFVGAYVQGSFALGAGDTNSDCDFIIAAAALPSGRAEAELHRLHDGIPTRTGFWTKHPGGVVRGYHVAARRRRDRRAMAVLRPRPRRVDLGHPLQQRALPLDPPPSRHQDRGTAGRGRDQGAGFPRHASPGRIGDGRP